MNKQTNLKGIKEAAKQISNLLSKFPNVSNEEVKEAKELLSKAIK